MKRKIPTLAAFMLVAAGSSQLAQAEAPVAQSIMGTDAMSFLVEDMSARHQLRVSCGTNAPSVVNFEAGEDPFFLPVDENGASLVDGDCHYELRTLVDEDENGMDLGVPRVQYGSFEISGGAIATGTYGQQTNSEEVK